MELYVLVAGTMPSQHRWHEDLLAQFLPRYKKGQIETSKDGKKIFQRLIVSPIIPYKIAFHKENLPYVLAMVGTEDYVLKRYKRINFLAKWFRKIFKLKDVPKPKEFNMFLQPNQVDKAVAVIPIGMKEDAYDDNGDEMV